MDQTIDGFRNDVFDHALRVLYLQRNQLQGRLVFGKMGKEQLHHGSVIRNYGQIVCQNQLSKMNTFL
ncbi:hypothetical protein SNF32_01255 [Enterococcus mundtii]|nr:hypothetical protein [Enterococcus mundtii]